MSRLTSPVAVVLAGLLAASLAWMGQPIGYADELDDAKQKLTEVQGEASQADEEYNQVSSQLESARTKLEQDTQAVADQQAEVDQLRQQIAVISLQQFQDHGVGSTVALFTSQSKEDAITSFAVSSRVADTTSALLRNYQLGKASLDELVREQQATVDSIAADQARLEELKTLAHQKAEEAQDLVDRLEEQKRAAAAAAAARGTGGGGLPSNYAPPPVPDSATAAAIVSWAMARVGYPYVYGGSGPNAYDCSGFTQAAYASVGISLPHSATSQFNYGAPVARADLQAGDLVFFYSGPGHVGIYVGAGMIVDARNESIGIVYRPLDDFMPITGYRRLL